MRSCRLPFLNNSVVTWSCMFETLAKFEKAGFFTALDICNSRLVVFALAVLLLRLWLGLRHLLILLLLPLPPGHCDLERTLQLCLRVILGFHPEIELHTTNVALCMPLLFPWFQFTPLHGTFGRNTGSADKVLTAFTSRCRPCSSWSRNASASAAAFSVKQPP